MLPGGQRTWIDGGKRLDGGKMKSKPKRMKESAVQVKHDVSN